MTWDPVRFGYRDRDHQQAQLFAAALAAGDITGKSVADVGCGTGDLLLHLPDDIDYVGIDTNAEAVIAARETYRDRRFRVSRWCPRAQVVVSVAALQCDKEPAETLRGWWRAASELLVVTCVQDWRSTWWEADVDPWDGLPEPEVSRVDDWYLAVLRK